MDLSQGPASTLASFSSRSFIVCWILLSPSQTHIAHGFRVSAPPFVLGTAPASGWELFGASGTILGASWDRCQPQFSLSSSRQEVSQGDLGNCSP